VAFAALLHGRDEVERRRAALDGPGPDPEASTGPADRPAPDREPPP